jgi:transcription antitermination factor NusG
MDKQSYKWYLLKVVGGREEKKIAEIEAVLAKKELQQEVVELKFFGQQKPELKGLIFCHCQMSHELVRAITRVKGVVGFVARDSKEDLPLPLAPVTLKRVWSSLETPTVNYVAVKADEVKEGELVRIARGAFVNYEGRINNYDRKKQKVKLVLEKLGWELVDVPLADCERIV